MLASNAVDSPKPQSRFAIQYIVATVAAANAAMQRDRSCGPGIFRESPENARSAARTMIVEIAVWVINEI